MVLCLVFLVLALCKWEIVNNRIIPSMHSVRKLLIFLINTLLLYIPLLALTDRQNYGGTNTLALRGLEEPFFLSSCAVVSVFCSGGK